MRKKKLLSTLFAGLLMIVGTGVLTGCQTADKSAVAPTAATTVKIMEDKSSGARYADVILGISNPTIYNVTEVKFTYEIFKEDASLGVERDVPLDLFVKHGVAGYLPYTVKIDSKGPYADATEVSIIKIDVTGYQTVWETYLAPFIVAIVFVGISIIFFAFEIFGRKLTRDMVKQMMKEKLASSIITLLLVIIICLIPLMFASWVTTLILVGGFVASLICCGLLSLIKIAFIKK